MTLPVIALAASTKTAVSARHLNGTYINSNQENVETPTEFYEFSKNVFSGSAKNGSPKGKYSITGDTIVFVHSHGETNTAKFSQTSNSITLTFNNSKPITYVRATNEHIAAIKRARAEFARKFIALSENKMTWAEAECFCKQKGGKLPLVNGSISYALKESSPKGITVNGFELGKWPFGLPQDTFWTGTVNSLRLDYFLVVETLDGSRLVVVVDGIFQSNANRVVCVP